MKLKQKPAMIVIMFEKSYLKEKRQKHGAVIDFFATKSASSLFGCQTNLRSFPCV